MAEGVFTKLAIACEYLDLAMQLYVEQENYFCAIHLAAAAEELFGSHLPERIECTPYRGKHNEHFTSLRLAANPPKKNYLMSLHTPRMQSNMVESGLLL